MPSASSITRELVPWYRDNHRKLPWRSSTDPYRIWLSEVILQQTRVDQGLAYWQRFVEAYPSVADLAAASEEEVLNLWQGLGYYSRARNLRAAAIQVMEDHDGRYPTTMEGLLSLKGVGDYTAAAIASIAYGIPSPVLDGNVYRVLARLHGITTPIDRSAGKTEFHALASRHLDRAHPGDHNQAMMELGATVCLPRTPLCAVCPLKTHCVAHATERTADFPVKAHRTKVRTRFFNYLHIETGDGLYLQQRIGKDIWKGLYELPLIETIKAADKGTIRKELAGRSAIPVAITARSNSITHVLSHQRIETIFWKVAPIDAPPSAWIAVEASGLERYPVPRLIERYLNDEVPMGRP